MGTFKRLTEGVCVWCVQKTEGLEVAFEDGLRGFLCKRCFWNAAKVRSKASEKFSERPKGQEAK